MLNLDCLPDKTRKTFEQLAGFPALRDFTLIGGTALALQLGHRYSEDLDFWLPENSLIQGAVDRVKRVAEEAGVNVQLTTSQDLITKVRIIQGENLLNFSRDYMFNDTKVTFFARYDLPYQRFDTFPRVVDENVSFALLGLDGIFAMKSHVIHHRVRSRDLYDLKVFLKNGKTLEELFETAQNIDPDCTQGMAKDILSGKIPLDAEDEGLKVIGIEESIEDIYGFFKNAIDDYEQRAGSRIGF